MIGFQSDEEGRNAWDAQRFQVFANKKRGR
jgi:hypothetical protein